MPIEVKYDDQRKILDIHVSGKPTLSEVTSTLETITSSKDYPPDTGAIWDIRQADLSSFEPELIGKLIELRSQFKQRVRLKSVFIATTSLQLAFSRAIILHAERKIPQEAMVFKEYSEGEKFILEGQ